MFEGPFGMSMIKKARDKGLAEIELIDLREYGIGPRKQVDDTPYGGGDGMVLRPEPVINAIEHVRSQQHATSNKQQAKTILLTPQGVAYSQAKARELSEEEHLILVCGHYEGFDERIREFADMQLSIGDYVLTGGEIPAMAVTDSVVRLIPGVLGGEESLQEESFNDGETIEYPHYTRPAEYKGMQVPEVLLSGNHAEIAKWRQKQAVKRTQRRKSNS